MLDLLIGLIVTALVLRLAARLPERARVRDLPPPKGRKPS
jgi:hypothetical protein